jgi:cobalt/nickel transport system permease protein
VHLEEFAEGATILHRMDPRVKFLTAGPFLALTAISAGIKAPAYALLVSFVLAVLGRLEPLKLLQRLAVVNIFVLLLWVFVPFSLPGEVLFEFGPLSATYEGLLLALQLTLKSNAIVVATIAVFGTTGAMSLAHALVHLRAPVKLVYLFFFFYRYVSVLHEEYTRLRNAMRVRGFHAGADTHTYRCLANLIGMLIVRSYERSERIYEAMLCRGFHGHFPVMGHFHLHGSDLVMGAALAAASLGVVLAA